MKLDFKQIFLIYKIKYSTEYRFNPKRKWRFDFILLPESLKIAIEYEGGTWSGGRHTSGKGYSKDCEKYNTAVAEGWKVLRYTADMLRESPELIAQQIIKVKDNKEASNVTR